MDKTRQHSTPKHPSFTNIYTKTDDVWKICCHHHMETKIRLKNLLPGPTQSLCVFTAWHIWLARNARIYKQKPQTPQQTFQITVVTVGRISMGPQSSCLLHGSLPINAKNKSQDQLQLLSSSDGLHWIKNQYGRSSKR